MTAPTTTRPVGGGGLRHRRREQRHRQRAHRVLLLRIVALLVVAAVASVVALRTVGRTDRAPARPTAVGRSQHTLLLAVGAPSAAAQSVALFAVDPASKSGGALLIPPDTLVDGPGGTVGGSAPVTPADELAGAVSGLLGVHVDATWRLAPAGLAALVDRLGGVSVDVDTAIATPTLRIAAGAQPLTGAQAAAYALYAADTEQARANRTRLVLDAVLAKLPPPAALAGLLGSLGADSSPSQPTAALADTLDQLAASSLADNETVLPTTTLDTGGTTPSFAFDKRAATPVLDGLFAGSRLTGAGAVGTRVEVVNDSGRPNLATGARSRLTHAGLSFVRAVNDQPFGQYQRSSILVFDDSAASLALGHRTAAALGIPSAPVLVSTQTTSVADALAVLAADYPG